MSVSTVGLVDFRSDKERTAAYTRSTRNAARKTAKYTKKAAKQGAQAPAYAPQPMYVQPPMYAPAPQGPPPGWYSDQAATLRWWDGVRWTEHTQQPAPPPATATEYGLTPGS
jgi:hypothetical protein